MKVEVSSHPAGFSVYTVESNGSVFELSAFGGQLWSWTKAGVPILFANREAAIVDGQTAYRGGAPICFPYFSKGQLLPLGTVVEPQHGRARNSIWDVEVLADALVFRTEQPAAAGYGPTTFQCELTYRFADDLQIETRIMNVGDAEAPVQFVVHSYWATAAPAAAKVEGLGVRYLDNLAGYTERDDEASGEGHLPPFDRVYPNDAEEQSVQTEAYRLSIATEGCAGTVFWNPGANHPIKDLGSPDFVCVESGIVTPSRILAPQAETMVRIAYRANLS
jgi:glucose-6-phosphate 1-epimerase